MLLSGYGVELAIKNTEYKAVDDTKINGQLETNHPLTAGFFCDRVSQKQIFGFTDTKTVLNAEDEDTDDVHGFLFKNLR